MPNFRPKPNMLVGHKVRFEDVFHTQEDVDAPEWVLEALVEERIKQKRSAPGLAVITDEGELVAPLGHWIMQRADESMFVLPPERIAEDYDLV